MPIAALGLPESGHRSRHAAGRVAGSVRIDSKFCNTEPAPNSHSTQNGKYAPYWAFRRLPQKHHLDAARWQLQAKALNQPQPRRPIAQAIHAPSSKSRRSWGPVLGSSSPARWPVIFRRMDRSRLTPFAETPPMRYSKREGGTRFPSSRSRLPARPATLHLATGKPTLRSPGPVRGVTSRPLSPARGS
jgi:hypothetical protein